MLSGGWVVNNIVLHMGTELLKESFSVAVSAWLCAELIISPVHNAENDANPLHEF